LLQRLAAIALGVAVGGLSSTAARAVVCSDGLAAYRNTAVQGLTPAEAALWGQLGSLNGFYVTPVSARQVLAAKHIGGSLGNVVSFGSGPNAGNYTTTGFVDDPDSDLRLWEIAGTLAAWVPVYTGTKERDSTTTLFGKGGEPGPAVTVDPAGALGPPPADLKGWEWGPPDGAGSWGRNVVDRITFVAGTGLTIAVDLDRPIFGGLAEECHLSAGDSSGPWFIQKAGIWYLAGLSALVSGPFQHDAGGTPDGEVFDAMLFDKGGLWEGSPAFFNAEQFTDLPSSAFAVRVSSRAGWLLPLLDSDGDGVADSADNCTEMPNPAQADTDDDGFGNACDCDFDQLGTCNIGDFSIFVADFIAGQDAGTGTDMDGGGTVNIGDFQLFVPGFQAGAPGPSAVAP
jgi:hypothetical protein